MAPALTTNRNTPSLRPLAIWVAISNVIAYLRAFLSKVRVRGYDHATQPIHREGPPIGDPSCQTLAHMPEAIEIISTVNGCSLSFQVISHDNDETVFLAALNSPQFCGKVEASTFVSGEPTLLFNDMAMHWKGWKGEKVWESIDGSLILKAQADSTGHIRLTVAMEHFLDSLKVTLNVEAGQLENIAKNSSAVFHVYR